MYESLQRCKVEHKAQQRFANFLTIDAASSESDVDKTSGRADSICSGGSLREWQKQFGRDMETRRKFLERYQSGALCCKASPASSCTTYKTNKSNLSTLLNDLAEVNEDQKEDQIDVISQIPPEPEPPRLQRDSVCVLPEKLKRKTPCVFPYVETVQIENIEFEEESKPIEVISITPEETKAAWSWKNAFCSCCERRRSDPLQAEHLLSRDTKARSYGSTTI
uniref:Uncharacterized protein n=1 Tax=Plectus sambesii TaxID=2011161 RepID=A0A914WCD4_9BILA